jgi:hypothetical protein
MNGICNDNLFWVPHNFLLVYNVNRGYNFIVIEYEVKEIKNHWGLTINCSLIIPRFKDKAY